MFEEDEVVCGFVVVQFVFYCFEGCVDVLVVDCQVCDVFGCLFFVQIVIVFVQVECEELGVV